MSNAKVSVRIDYKLGKFAEVTIATDKNVKPAFNVTGWFLPPADFPELSVEIPSSQAVLSFFDGQPPAKGLIGLQVDFKRTPATDPTQINLSYCTGKPASIDTLTAGVRTTRPKVDGSLDQIPPKYSALGYAIWN